MRFRVIDVLQGERAGIISRDAEPTRLTAEQLRRLEEIYRHAGDHDRVVRAIDDQLRLLVGLRPRGRRPTDILLTAREVLALEELLADYTSALAALIAKLTPAAIAAARRGILIPAPLEFSIDLIDPGLENFLKPVFKAARIGTRFIP